MTIAEWNYFSYNTPGTFLEDKNSSVVATNGEPASLYWKAKTGNNSWLGYMYNGYDIDHFPNVWCRVSVAMRNDTVNWAGSSGPGMVVGFSPNLLNGSIVDASLLNSICIGYSFSPALSLRPFYLRDGAVTQTFILGDTTNRTPIAVNNSFIQFEAMLVFNPLFSNFECYGSIPGSEAKLSVRWNTGSALEDPGGPNWSSWSDSWIVNWDTHSSNLFNDGYLNGVYPWIGAVGAGWSSPSYSNAYFDYVMVTYGLTKG